MTDFIRIYQELFMIVGILIGNLVLKLALTKYFKKEETRNVLKLILNWVSAFVSIGLLLVYFSGATWLFDPLITFNNVPISIFSINLAIFIIILAIKLTFVMNKYILPKVYNRYDIGVGTQFTFNRLFQYIIITIAIFIALNTVGIDLSSLTIFAGVIGVGIGFGLQNIVSNFISGIIILFERPIQVGDRVIVDNIVGDVDEIKMRATIVKTLDNERIIIPNSFFLEEKVINRSYSDTRLRLVIHVGVSYKSDVRLVEKLLLESVDKIQETWKQILFNPASSVHFVGFGESSLDFKLFVWMNDPEAEYEIKSDLHFMILEKFREHNVEIPFPQQDVHIKKETSN